LSEKFCTAPIYLPVPVAVVVSSNENVPVNEDPAGTVDLRADPTLPTVPVNEYCTRAAFAVFNGSTIAHSAIAGRTNSLPNNALIFCIT
jgi:hypothetical protein